jgi:hypothetical protein
MDERISYEESSTNMNKLNDQQRLIVNDIIYIKTQIWFKTLTHFLKRGCRNRKKNYFNVYHTKHVKIL